MKIYIFLSLVATTVAFTMPNHGLLRARREDIAKVKNVNLLNCNGLVGSGSGCTSMIGSATATGTGYSTGGMPQVPVIGGLLGGGSTTPTTTPATTPYYGTTDSSSAFYQALLTQLMNNQLQTQSISPYSSSYQVSPYQYQTPYQSPYYSYPFGTVG